MALISTTTADDILFAPISRALKVGDVVIGPAGQRMRVVAVGSIDPDYLTCEWPDADGSTIRENYWRSSVKPA